MSVGSSLVAPADTDTGMGTLIMKKTLTETPSGASNTGSNPYYSYVCQFGTPDAVGNWTEFGLNYDDDALYDHGNFGRGTVTAATNANPAVITSTDHGLVNGERVVFSGVGGMTQLNFTGSNFYFAKSLSSSTFELYSDEALTSGINSGAYGSFTSGGEFIKSYEKLPTEVGIVTVEIEGANG